MPYFYDMIEQLEGVIVCDILAKGSVTFVECYIDIIRKMAICQQLRCYFVINVVMAGRG